MTALIPPSFLKACKKAADEKEVLLRKQKYFRSMRLALEKQMMFLRNEKLISEWYRLKQSVKKDNGQLLKDRRFLWENGIEDIVDLPVKMAGRTVVVPEPYYEDIKVRWINRIVCLACYRTFDLEGVDSQAKRCTHCGADSLDSSTHISLDIPASVKLKDYREVWAIVQNELLPPSRKIKNTRIATNTARDARWARLKKQGKTLNEILNMELRRKDQRQDWRTKLESGYPRHKLIKVIREAVRRTNII